MSAKLKKKDAHKGVTEQDLVEALLACRKDPARFITGVLGVRDEHLWDKPREIAQSIADNQLTAVPAAHSVSKTWLAGKLVPWFKCCYRPSTIITTAPSDNQVKNQLWREIEGSYNSATIPLGGKLTTMKWDMSLPDSELAKMEPHDREAFSKDFAIGFSTSPDQATTHATKMQGWHNTWMLIILDEACGLLRAITRTVMVSLLTNERVKVLAIGNPTDPESEFADWCRLGGKLDHLERSSDSYFSDQGFRVIPISVRDTPNYRADREVIPSVAGRSYERQILARYPDSPNGDRNDGYLIRCGAAFPKTREGTYYAHEVAQAAREHRIGEYQYDPAFPVYRFADFGDVWTAAIDCQFIRGKIRVINDYWDNAGEITTAGGRVQLDGTGYQALAKSMQSMPYIWGNQHFAGPDLEGSNAHGFAQTASTRDLLRGVGFNFRAVIRHNFDDGISAVRAIWPLLEIDESNAGTLLKGARGYGKKKNEQLSTDGEPVYHDQPAKTWHRHIMDALRHTAIAYRYMPIGDEYIGNVQAMASIYDDGDSEEDYDYLGASELMN